MFVLVPMFVFSSSCVYMRVKIRCAWGQIALKNLWGPSKSQDRGPNDIGLWKENVSWYQSLTGLFKKYIKQQIWASKRNEGPQFFHAWGLNGPWNFWLILILVYKTVFVLFECLFVLFWFLFWFCCCCWFLLLLFFFLLFYLFIYLSICLFVCFGSPPPPVSIFHIFCTFCLQLFPSKKFILHFVKLSMNFVTVPNSVLTSVVIMFLLWFICRINLYQRILCSCAGGYSHVKTYRDVPPKWVTFLPNNPKTWVLFWSKKKKNSEGPILQKLRKKL